MNKKKLCATLTLSAFAASLLPGMAFAADNTVTPNPANVNTAEITLALGSGSWLDDQDTITIKAGQVNEKDKFTLAFPDGGGSIKLTPKGVLEVGTYKVHAINTNAGKGEEAATNADWTITVESAPEFTFAIKEGTTNITLAGEKLVVGDALCLLKADGTAGAAITDAEGDPIVVTDEKKIIVAADLLVAGKYAITHTADDVTTIVAYAVYPEELAKELAEVNKEAITKAQNVADAIPATLDVSVGSDKTGNVLDTIKGNTAVVKALKDNGFNVDGSAITIKTVKGDIARCIDDLADGVIIVDGNVTGTVVYDVDGKATKEVAVTVVKADAIADVVKAYIAENFADNYDAATKTATVTMKKGDAFNMTLADAIVEDALSPNNKIVLSSSKVAVDSQYIDLENGLIIAAPAKDHKATLTLTFADTAGDALDNVEAITIDLTIAADVPSEFDPTEDFTKEELEALDEAQLAEVKEVADQAKADALTARNAKAEAAAKDYADQGLDLSKPEDLAKATELYLSYSAERKAYKEAKAYAALVDDVIAAGK